MARRRVTQREIARASGVSQTTVSLILAGDDSINVSDATRERVLMTADALDYVPQAAARALVQGKSQVLALILNDPHAQIFRDPYIPNVMTGITEVAGLQNYRLLVERIPAGRDLSIANNLLRSQQADGVILLNVHTSDEILESLQNSGFPILVLDTFNHHGIATVAIDHIGGIRLAVSHLVKLGHKRIGCIPYTPLDHPHIIRRFKAYVSVLEEAGLSLDMSIVVSGSIEPETGVEAMKRILRHRHRPTAVFAMNDTMALGALYACAEAKVHVPGDMAVVGYDDMRFAAFTVPALTTVRAPEVELGRAAAKSLLQQINGEQRIQVPQLLKTELMIRKSCGAT